MKKSKFIYFGQCALTIRFSIWLEDQYSEV